MAKDNPKPYNPLRDFLKRKFGRSVHRVSLNAGFSCPNRDGTKGVGGCIYCNNSTLLPKAYKEGLEIGQQLDKGIKYIRKRMKADSFIAYFQTYSNTYGDINRLENLYKTAAVHPDVAALAISTRPDCLDNNILELVKEISRIKYLWLEIGLQSSNERTLKILNRGHTVYDFQSAYERADKLSIPVCAHVILGLPNETKDEMLDTARFLAGINIWGVKIHPLHILRDTPLERMYKRGNIKVMGLDEYIHLVVDFLEELPQDTIIHRLCGSTPRRFLVAPEWGADRYTPANLIRQLLEERKTFQGAKFKNMRINQ